MTLVLGATGTVGGAVAREPIAAGERPRLLVRNPDQARAFAETAEVVRGDLEDIASLRAAMHDIDKVFMMSTGTNAVALEGNVVDAAVAEGITHVVKLSVISAEAPAITFARWHNAAEQKLKASGLAWTMLRPGNFMTNALGWAMKAGYTGAVTDTVQELLGRPVATFESWATRNAGAFQG